MRDDLPSFAQRAGRFLFKRRLGEGAFGVVWEVYDRQHDARVALKLMSRTDPAALYRFKREFRALADLVHPNLATLYELLSIDDTWFFTMEFVDGVDFISYVCRKDECAEEQSTGKTGIKAVDATWRRDQGSTRMLSSMAGESAVIDAPTMQSDLGSSLITTERRSKWYNEPTMASEPPPPPDRIPTVEIPKVGRLPRPSFDAARIRATTLQLALGLNALHEAQKLHRDIKPSNVLVSREGRVVILDFGLITEIGPEDGGDGSRAIVGTPGYMSPEQAIGRGIGPATDWYSVGVMLYVAFTGTLPFVGSPMQILLAQQQFEPARPSLLVSDIPEDLEQLCMDLLRRDPEARPTGREVLWRLGGPVSVRMSLAPPPTSKSSIFVGRKPHLGVLSASYEITRRRRAAAAIVYGGSGLGKSTLVRHFLSALRAREPNALIFTGRCYQRESVPFKALDSLIDALSVHLQRLDPFAASDVMPRGVEPLARLFPVLRQVPSIANPQSDPVVIADPQELRRHAIGALRELLTRLAARRPLVLFIDDLQWSDADSDAVLAEIVRPPEPPPLLLIATYRLEDPSASPLMRALSDPGRPSEEGVELRTLRVGEFSRAEAEALAAALLGPGEPSRAQAIARESGGSPLFIDAMVKHIELESDESGKDFDPGAKDHATPIGFAEMIQARIDRLPGGARRLLDAIVVAGRPVDLSIAQRVAGSEAAEPSALSLLGAAHLVRTRTESHDALEVEIFHDRIREHVLGRISAERSRDLHERFALALEAAGNADPEVLAEHFEASGHVDKAVGYALEAADEAFDALAFERAAELYRRALKLDSTRDALVRIRLGDALMNAGRGAEAADAYLLAARLAKGSMAIDLRRRAAEQLLISGHVERGLSLIGEVLDVLGMKSSPLLKSPLVSLLGRRAHLKLRGFKFKERSAKEIPSEELMRIDACWAIAVGLSLADMIRGADFQARHLLLALEAGEPYRIARALAVEIAYIASAGIKNQARVGELIEMTMTLAERIDHPHALGLGLTMAGAARFLTGEFKKGLELAERGSEILRKQCTGVTWELDTADVFVLSTLHKLGLWKEMGVRLEEILRSAKARGDLYAAVHLALDTACYVDLAADMPEEARRRLDEAFRPAARRSFDMQHATYLNTCANIHVYRGDASMAYELIVGRWGDIRRSFTLEAQMGRVDLIELRARAAIGWAAEYGAGAHRRKELSEAAEQDIRRIESEGILWGNALAKMLRSGVALLRGNQAMALSLAAEAESMFTAADMEIHSAVARKRRGELMGGEGGNRLIAEADMRLRAQGVKNPERMSRYFAPR